MNALMHSQGSQCKDDEEGRTQHLSPVRMIPKFQNQNLGLPEMNKLMLFNSNIKNRIVPCN